ncbi:hypothetical protein P3X46_015195 [Hevea brasiliensis]|uniref:Uncharacterized protein n=1 Tax=Hevea brasiliensis TaxID=3981 RepID=A0ABQ9LZ57_HEVBR|nr:uncharacterized protein LOC110658789 [Hevea brasiliensis]KAJ9171893.1 hypothetical protein P3X46_015195 [Hevea brasiliensis]
MILSNSMENLWSFYSEQMDDQKGVDLSSCLLLEASGDSEVDFDPNLAINDLVDDDAESCSCDVSDYYSCVGDLSNACEVEQASVTHVVDDHKEVEEEQEDEIQEDEVHGYHQEWANGLTLNQKSCVSVESINDQMNEMEKNRLFWETCLAS